MLIINIIIKDCSSLKSLPNISKWNTENVTDMSYMFSSRHIVSQPKFKKNITSGRFLNNYQEHTLCWTESFLDMVYILGIREDMYPPASFSKLPDLSKWNTKNVKNMSFMFEKLSNLKSLPDISKWDTSNVETMEAMFQNCKNLLSFPDIGKWNISTVNNMFRLFLNCISITFG